MEFIKSLKLTAIPTAANDNDQPTNRRLKLIERLEDQKALIKDPALVRKVQRWTKKDGQRVMTEKQLKVHPWWRRDEKGAIVFFVRYAGKPIEFEKGKAGIAVPSPEKLGAVIDTVISAVRQGEVDALLKGRSPVGKAKKTA